MQCQSLQAAMRMRALPSHVQTLHPQAQHSEQLTQVSCQDKVLEDNVFRAIWAYVTLSMGPINHQVGLSSGTTREYTYAKHPYPS